MLTAPGNNTTTSAAGCHHCGPRTRFHSSVHARAASNAKNGYAVIQCLVPPKIGVDGSAINTSGNAAIIANSTPSCRAQPSGSGTLNDPAPTSLRSRPQSARNATLAPATTSSNTTVGTVAHVITNG